MEIKLTRHDKRIIQDTDDVYGIMQRVLLRENRIDREKEHLWIIGMNQSGYILYIELIALGSYRSVDVEPMNVFRVAVMKNASRVILVHNHPSGSLTPSSTDKDVTDRLIQVGRILNIELVDHLIITPKQYLSFRQIDLMQELEQSLKYVPTYQKIERVRLEEKQIAQEKLAAANDKIKTAQQKVKAEKERREKLELEKKVLINALLKSGASIEDIAKILEMTVRQIKGILAK